MGKGPQESKYEYAQKVVVKKKAKKEKRGARKIEEASTSNANGNPRQKPVPRTIDSMRVKNETILNTLDEETVEELNEDEFTNIIPGPLTDDSTLRSPKVLITTSQQVVGETSYTFVRELMDIIPNSEYFARRNFKVKEIVKFAKNRDYVHIVMLHEDRKNPIGLTFVHLPDGPTMSFRLSNYMPCKKIHGHGQSTEHYPELILNHFATRLGHRVGRMLMSLFPQVPGFEGRQAVTFHNQRDFVFFRRHRYVFKQDDESTSGEKGKMKELNSSQTTPKDKSDRVPSKSDTNVGLQEIGPRFTLKLKTLHQGTFDMQKPEYEFIHKPAMDKDRKRFFL